MSTISVISPVYNVAQYLDKAVRSVCDQTYPDWELILVDDGSTDGSAALCDAWAKKDGRIRVLHKENGGVSTARNAGLDAALGAYIYFLDPDDYIHPQTLAVLLELIQQYDAQIALGFTRGTHVRDYVEPDRDEYLVQTASGKQALTYLYTDPAAALRFFGFNPTTVFSKMYKRAIFQTIRFDPTARLAEDLTIIPYLLDSAATIVSTDQRLYFVYHRPGSLTRSTLSPNRAADLCRTVCRMYQNRLQYFRAKRKDGYETLLRATYQIAFYDLIEKREKFRHIRDCRRILCRGLFGILRGFICPLAAQYDIRICSGDLFCCAQTGAKQVGCKIKLDFPHKGTNVQQSSEKRSRTRLNSVQQQRKGELSGPKPTGDAFAKPVRMQIQFIRSIRRAKAACFWSFDVEPTTNTDSSKIQNAGNPFCQTIEREATSSFKITSYCQLMRLNGVIQQKTF